MSSYPGGKESCHQKLINLIPPHGIYVEPFLGGGAIMRLKRPAALSIGVEVNEEVLWDTALKVTPAPIVIDGDVDGEFHWHNALRPEDRYLFIKASALWFLKHVHDNPDTFIYVDPPYLRSTRKRQDQRLYLHEFCTEEEHEALLALLCGMSCSVMISGYWSELYADLLKGWRRIKFDSMTRGGGMATEWVWMNYKTPTALHDYRFLGDNFRQRERIKRKKTRWVERFKKTDPQERAAILWALNESGILGDGYSQLASPEVAIGSQPGSASPEVASMPAVVASLK